MKNCFLETLSGKVFKHPPLWLMRQAGRYLPEYRDLRAQAGSFLDLVYTPKLAAEVTLQPLRRFGFDAAILFSDILVVPQAMGLDLKFEAGEGPVLMPVKTQDDLSGLRTGESDLFKKIYETVALVHHALQEKDFNGATLIGFAGGPWTVACYMVCGSGGSHEFEEARARAFSDPDFFDDLIARITESTITYLRGQILAGAGAIQIFDSWAGAAGGILFDRYVTAPTRAIVETLACEFPHVPIIGFPRGGGNRTQLYARQTGVSGVGADYATDLKKLREDLGDKVTIQGNLDPLALKAGGEMLEREIDRILGEMTGTPHIFNLGHGVLPETPIPHVEQLVARVRGKRS